MKSRSYPGPEVTGFALRGSRISFVIFGPPRGVTWIDLGITGFAPELSDSAIRYIQQIAASDLQ